MMIFNSLIILSLIPIAFQDIKKREIHVSFLMCFIMLSLFSAIYAIGMYETIIMSTISLTYLLFVFSLISIYFSCKFKQVTNIIDSQIGLGDIFFLIGVTFIFPVLILIFFLIVSSILILILHNKKQTIPLAGYYSIGLIFYLLIEIIFNINRYIYKF